MCVCYLRARIINISRNRAIFYIYGLSIYARQTYTGYKSKYGWPIITEIIAIPVLLGTILAVSRNPITIGEKNGTLHNARVGR